MLNHTLELKNETNHIQLDYPNHAPNGSHKHALIDTLQVIEQVCEFKREIINIALFPAKDIYFPNFCFIGIVNFEVYNIEINTSHFDKCNKRLELSINTKFLVKYSDGYYTLYQQAKNTFLLTIEKMHTPVKNTRTFTSYPSSKSLLMQNTNSLKAIAVADCFGEITCPCTGGLILDIGVFFIILNTKTTELLVPEYFSE